MHRIKSIYLLLFKHRCICKHIAYFPPLTHTSYPSWFQYLRPKVSDLMSTWLSPVWQTTIIPMIWMCQVFGMKSSICPSGILVLSLNWLASFRNFNLLWNIERKWQFFSCIYTAHVWNVFESKFCPNLNDPLNICETKLIFIIYIFFFHHLVIII